MTRFRVKVCGITRPQDAALAAKLGADLIGVIFHPESPRVVSPRTAERVFASIPPTVHRVGVFVHTPTSEVVQLVKRLRLDFVQLHGNRAASDLRTIQSAGVKIIRAVHGESPTTSASNADIIMLDNITSSRFGGTGKTFAWSKRPRRKIPNLMLAGGLNEKNIEEGVCLFHPLIVDINSGVESAPGIKSPVKLTRFMRLCDRIRYGN